MCSHSTSGQDNMADIFCPRLVDNATPPMTRLTAGRNTCSGTIVLLPSPPSPPIIPDNASVHVALPKSTMPAPCGGV